MAEGPLPFPMNSKVEPSFSCRIETTVLPLCALTELNNETALKGKGTREDRLGDEVGGWEGAMERVSGSWAMPRRPGLP